MTALLTDNLPLLSGAPNGIKKLRGLILELAVRGKLVLQDPNDEPASELLKRIAEEKAQLVADGQIKKQKSLSAMAEEKQLFELPAGWEWASTATLTLRITDGTHHTPTYISSGIPFISVKDINGKTISFDNCKYISQEEHIAINSRCNPEQGDILLCRIGTLGRPTIVDTDIPFSLFVSVGLLKLPKKTKFSRYFHCVLSSPLMYRQYDQIKAGGSHTNKLNLGDIPRLFVPVPPLNEQHRIVAKVDELMTLCDRLEAHQADAEGAHAQLVQALLDSLTQASDATDFAANWQRLAEHFHTLFTTELSIDALKQTLLQLAVMGKLVPQNPSDEPATCLLKKSSIKNQPHTLQGWAEASLGDLGEIIGGSTPSKANTEFWSGDIPWVSPKDMKRPVIHDSEDHISAKALAETSLRAIPPKSLLMVVRGMILVHSFPVALTAREVTINQDMKALVPPAEISDYLLMYLQASKGLMVGLVDRSSHGTCKLTSEKLWSHIVSLPPLAEQHRIVAKVVQLMTICDQLKTRLTQARQLNEQLAITLVERALTEDGKQVPIATDRQVARTLLAAEITQRLHNQRTFGQRKLQKIIYLAEHAARLSAIQGDYLRDAAGPHDRQLMSKVEGEMQNHQWYERIERETIGHSYRPLQKAGQHQQAYSSAWSDTERATIHQVIELMRGWNTDRCEMTVTLYAAWNDFILEGHSVTDEAIVDEVMHSWNDTKLRFSKNEWLTVLSEMKKHEILIPTGFGKRTTGGMRNLLGRI
ncbi:restriction endonuclease subunit S [Pseudomonas koreensis]|uniref:restriction endonuclease subunit S n=1 Tax=Pseudomonas koreensis TaxID=198620 RepID=UPI001475CFBC|nr:restriction endonuclease subunit S [Pseudomonas koreensis]NNA58258.1 restriction endonuclease subunit S [Pseudomonas koreensis]